VLQAQGGSEPEARTSLETLCRAYWPPLYAYARSHGHSPHDAEDLTQGFFARLLEKEHLRAVQREKGRFRQFMLMAFKRFLSHEWEHQRAAKRGGGATIEPLDTTTAEGLFVADSGSAPSPDAAFDRRWALSLLERVLARLREEFASVGRTAEFTVLKPFLTADSATVDYARFAAELASSEGAVRVAVHRLRKRFRQLFREEIERTVADSADVDDELRHLVDALAE
jgi:RNA polymerase sigma factor (sigma-70 family)